MTDLLMVQEDIKDGNYESLKELLETMQPIISSIDLTPDGAILLRGIIS